MEEVYLKVEDLGGVIDKYFKGKDLITVIELIGLCEDLSCDLDRLQEEFEDYKENEDYAKFNPYKEYGVSEHDFH